MTIISLMSGAALLSWAATLLLVLCPLPILDHPNHRSLHERPVPCTGGLAIAISLVVVTAIAVWQGSIGPDLVLPLLVPWLFLLVVSFIDDIRHVPAHWRVICHLVAVLLLLAAVDIPFDLPASILLLLAVGWAINLFNFMDGMDGLAGGMAVIGAATLALLAVLAGDLDLGMLAALLAAAAAGFLLFNLPGARIFLGDAGSVPIGFLLAALVVSGVLRGSISLPLALLPFLPFIIDASLTLLRRVVQRKRFWEAHREHAYQRAVLAGMPVKHVLLLEYVFMTIGAGAAVLLRYQELGQSSSSSEMVAWSVLGMLAVAQAVIVGVTMNFPAGRTELHE